MKKSLLALALTLAATSALAIKPLSPEAAQERQSHFPEHKQRVLQLIAQRQSILNQEQSCVLGATDHAGMRACHETAKAAREAMAAGLKELRGKRRD